MTEDSKDRRDEPTTAQGGSDAPVEATGPQPTEQLPTATPHESQPQQPGFGPAGHQPGPAPAPPYAAYPQDPGVQHTAPMPPYPPEYGAVAPGGPAGPGGPGQPPGVPYPAAGPAPQPGGRGRAGLVAGAVVLALVAGGVGGAVGSLATRSDDSAPVTNALDAPVPKADNVSNAPAGSVPAAAQKVLPSVVMIRVAGAQAEGEGSGVVLSSDGLILTNNHVVSGAGPNARMQVQFNDGTTSSATVVGADPISDLAVVKASDKTGLSPIELGTSSNLQVGQSAVAVGSPLGLSGTVTTGIVSALNRPVSTSGEQGGDGSVISAIQTDAPINPGNSGGPLVDMSGKLIGLNTAIATLGTSEASGQQGGSIGLGFAIPVDQARRVADELIKTGHATYAQIGITVNRVDTSTGARVRDVVPDGPAGKAGIPAGAIVTKVNDQIIDSGNGLIAAVRSHQPGDKVKVTYTDDKGQNPKTVEVTLAAAPAEGGR
ncbi:trypsin-like peptidase domain-containing protein [Nocardia sp. BMG51109]|uniref:trypsin-like peptidase domain-containing protein n=1 Tax=Nocardia sp. BMG51109 TaxID=1056816 RepID=UPI000466924A|nr:trypsin-like peptidase domain-containing protein [Nocardia sp. BMG51109]